MSEGFVHLEVSTDCKFEVLRIVTPTMTVVTFRVKTSALASSDFQSGFYGFLLPQSVIS